MGTADLHLHTSFGDGLIEPAALLDHVEQRTDLDVIAVTEHDQLDAALHVIDLHARGRYRFEVIAGMEVTTLEGHLLALFVERPVPSLRPLARTLDAIHRQGGLAIVPHPMSPLTRSLGQRGIERIIRRRADGVWLDGIELANASPAGRVAATRARLLNETRYRLAETGGSDAHFLPHVGSARTRFPGRTAADLYRAVQERTTRAELGESPSLRALGVSALARQSWRALWATPKRVVGEPVRSAFGVRRSTYSFATPVTRSVGGRTPDAGRRTPNGEGP